VRFITVYRGHNAALSSLDDGVTGVVWRRHLLRGWDRMAQARKKILCIEDHRETAALIAEELIDRGFEVSIA
jgi:hypothetical protein